MECVHTLCVYNAQLFISKLYYKKRHKYYFLAKRWMEREKAKRERSMAVVVSGRFCPERVDDYSSEPTRVMCPWKL